MPDLTFSEAKAQLIAMENPTVEQLRDLVSRTSISQIDTSVAATATILYSGPLALDFYGDGAALRSGDVAVAMAAADPRLKIIDNTEVGALLFDNVFKSKLEAAAGADDLPRDFHPALIRAAAVVVMPFGALLAMGSGMPDPIANIASA